MSKSENEPMTLVGLIAVAFGEARSSGRPYSAKISESSLSKRACEGVAKEVAVAPESAMFSTTACRLLCCWVAPRQSVLHQVPNFKIRTNGSHAPASQTPKQHFKRIQASRRPNVVCLDRNAGRRKGNGKLRLLHRIVTALAWRPVGALVSISKRRLCMWGGG